MTIKGDTVDMNKKQFKKHGAFSHTKEDFYQLHQHHPNHTKLLEKHTDIRWHPNPKTSVVNSSAVILVRQSVH